MNRTQIVVLGLAVASFGGAYMAFNSLTAPQQAPHVAAQQSSSVATERVLVASTNIDMGGAITASTTQWIDWPKAAVSDQMIIQPKNGPTDEDTKGALARVSIMKDEPIRRDRIVKAGEGSLLSAILPAGKRAVNVTIENNGGQNGQPFIAANDKVDIIKLARDDDASRAKAAEVMVSQTIVENVLVLGVSNNTATLELDPDQAQLVTLAQKQTNASLRLSLRSILDSAGDARTVAKPQEAGSGGLTVVRFGTSAH